MCASAIVVAGALAVAVNTSVRAHEGEHFAAGEPGNAKKPFRVVQVTMIETEDKKQLFEPDALTVKRGEQIKFILTNKGARTHEFLLGTTKENRKHGKEMMKHPGMKHHEPNGETVKSGGKGELLWHFTERGRFEFACLIPGHYQAGMHGTILVK